MNQKERNKKFNVDMLDIEQKFIDGTKGKIEIYYFSEEDLDKLIEKFS